MSTQGAQRAVRAPRNVPRRARSCAARGAPFVFIQRCRYTLVFVGLVRTREGGSRRCCWDGAALAASAAAKISAWEGVRCGAGNVSVVPTAAKLPAELQFTRTSLPSCEKRRPSVLGYSCSFPSICPGQILLRNEWFS